MSWPIKMVESVQAIFDAVERGECVVGWSVRATINDHESVRQGVYVMLPGPHNGWNPFDPYRCYVHEGKANRWSVSGEWPNVTVTPSINAPGQYHGFIQDGVLTDDCEGRTYDALGRLVRRG